MEEGRVGKKILHDAQIMGVFPGGSIFRKNTSEVKVLEEILLKLSRPTYHLESLFYSPQCTCAQLGGSCSTGAYAPLDVKYNEFLLYYTKPHFAHTAFIQERRGTVGGESSLLSPLFHNKIGWVKVIQIIKVCIQQLIRTDPNAD